MSKVIFDEGLYIFLCPHCEGEIIVEKKDVNCAIFRHGILIKNGKQINPHLSKKECDAFVEHKKIYGCGKPFKLDVDGLTVDVCEYI
jgi:hypothetical protein